MEPFDFRNCGLNISLMFFLLMCAKREGRRGGGGMEIALCDTNFIPHNETQWFLLFFSRYSPQTATDRRLKRMPSCRRQEASREIDPVGKTTGIFILTISRRTNRRCAGSFSARHYVGIKARFSGSFGLLGLFRISQFANHNTGSAGLDLQHCVNSISTMRDSFGRE